MSRRVQNYILYHDIRIQLAIQLSMDTRIKIQAAVHLHPAHSRTSKSNSKSASILPSCTTIFSDGLLNYRSAFTLPGANKTVFAPTNAAFWSLAADLGMAWEALLQQTHLLDQVRIKRDPASMSIHSRKPVYGFDRVACICATPLTRCAQLVQFKASPGRQ